MKDKRKLTPRQFGSLLLLAMISPVFRQVPGTAAESAGSGAWLSALTAAGVFLLLGLSIGGLWLRRRAGAAAGARRRTLPGWPGRGLSGLYTLYICLYAGFVLRSGAERFVAAVYPESEPWVFLGVLLALSLAGALGELKALGRVAELVTPFLLLLLLVVLFFSLGGAEREALSLRDAEVQGLARGSLPVLDTLCVGFYILFLSEDAETEGLFPSLLSAGAVLGVLAVLLSVATVGTFGAELTSRLNYPFFVLIRGVEMSRLLERTEPLIVGQWVITDFALLSALLHIVRRTGTRSFGGTERGWALAGAGIALLFAVVCAPDAAALRALERRWVPAVNAGMAAVMGMGYLLNSECGMRNAE